MPWSPTFENVAADPRLDPYRGRAGRLTKAGTPAGYVLVETDYLQARTGGFAWWRRWAAPSEYAIVSVLNDDEVVDGQTYAFDELAGALARWAAGTHLSATTYDVNWLDVEESDRVHQQVFGHHH